MFVREHTRYPVELAVRMKCATWADYLDLHTSNLSRGGLFVPSPMSAPVGTEIAIELALPNGSTVKLRAEIVHVAEKTEEQVAGMGVMFMELEETTRKSLDDAVRLAKANAPKPVVKAVAPAASPAATTAAPSTPPTAKAAAPSPLPTKPAAPSPLPTKAATPSPLPVKAAAPSPLPTKPATPATPTAKAPVPTAIKPTTLPPPAAKAAMPPPARPAPTPAPTPTPTPGAPPIKAAPPSPPKAAPPPPPPLRAAPPPAPVKAAPPLPPTAKAAAPASAAEPEVKLPPPLPPPPTSDGWDAPAEAQPEARAPRFADAVENALVDELARRSGLSPHEQLGIAADADDAAITEAHGRLKERYAPSIFARYGASTGEVILKINEAVDAAYRRLLDPSERRALAVAANQPKAKEPTAEEAEQKRRGEEARNALRAGIDRRIEEACAHRDMGRLDDAIRTFEHVLQLDRKHEFARAELVKLRDLKTKRKR